MEFNPPVHFEPQRRQERKARPNTQKCPQITQINTDGLSRDSIAERGLGRQTAAENRCIGSPLRTHAFVTLTRYSGLRSRRAQTSPLLISCGCMDRLLLPNRRKERRNRRALARRPVGRTATTDACVRSRPAAHRQAAIDRSQTFPPSIFGTAASSQRQPLGVLGVLAVHLVGGGLCVSLCALCL